jgi:hypothetical protein
MSLTLTTQNVGGTTTVTASSTLTPPVYFFWFLNGVFLNQTTDPTWTFRPDAGEQCFVEVHDDTNPAYDPSTFVSAAAPGRRLLQWIRSLDAACAAYEIQQAVNGGAWTTIAVVAADPLVWQYSYTTDPLTDLASYAWQILPLDAAGRAGTAVSISPEIIVCTPAAPTWTATFASGTLTINA